MLIVRTKKEYLVKDATAPYYTPEGFVPVEWLEAPGEYTFDHGGRVQIYPARVPDLLRHYQRGPQVVQMKDTGLIIARTGINSQSVVVDAGCGGAHQTTMLANIAQHVYAYEINQKHYEICKQNILLPNVTLTHGSVADHTVAGVDVFCLDLPEPWQLFDMCHANLVQGGYMVVYLPNTVQMQQTLNDMPETFECEYVCETLERSWKHDTNIFRPNTTMLAHSGFLAFLRKK